MATPLGSALLGAFTFSAKQHGADECDAKGLPLSLNSTNIIGRFEGILKTLHHPNLATYLAAKKLKNERMIVVTEWYDDCLENHIKSSTFSSLSSLSRLAQQILSALSYLEERGITHRALAADNVLVTPEGAIKLHNYGFYHMTEHGTRVLFPIGSPRYMAPEVIMLGPDSLQISSPKVDVWSMGILLLEIFMETPVYPDLFLKNAIGTLFKRIVLLMQNYQLKSINPLITLLETHNSSDKELDADLESFLSACLTPLPSQRPDAKTLLDHPFITNYSSHQDTVVVSTPYPILPSPFTTLVRCSSLPIQNFDLQQQVSGEIVSAKQVDPPDHLRERPLREVYYLWSLAGGDLELEMKKVELILSKPPIFNMPSLVTKTGSLYGTSLDQIAHYDGSVVKLSLEQLRKRLELMTTENYYPLLESNEESNPHGPSLHESATLPLAIKENDVEYQFHRTIMFSRLLESYPYSRKFLVAEAMVDVCPLLRGEIWAAILGVKGDLLCQYSNIDKDSETSTDRQIDVDIPRCHQYHTLLSSKIGHKKFKRILKSWVLSHPQLVYWQGLDSLCAPFLALSFNNEALAYSSLSAFIDRFLYKFFLKNNSPVMQEYLAVFSQLIAFHDPKLFNHLDNIAFFPELYAIPWFLTMFTHILPLDQIYHLWDTLLLGNSSFPLFVGLAILQQLRADLLSFGFNECILMFSDMPVIDIQSCIQTAVKLFQTTPISVYVRFHQQSPSDPMAIPAVADRQPLSLDALKEESCPQISAHDLITLCHLEPQTPSYNVNRTDPIRADVLLFKGVSKSGKKLRPRALIVDIRSNEEFRQGHVPHSLNIPHESAFQPDGSLLQSPASATLASLPRGRIIVVVGNKGDSGAIFGRQLVRLNFSKVCVLYNGAGVLRTLGLLSSLQDDV